MTAQDIKTAAQFIQEILDELGDEEYIFRGESRLFDNAKKGEKPISSGLYRKFCMGEYPITNENYSAVLEAEKQFMEGIDVHFPGHATAIEKLTALQHQGGLTALIDFSYDIHVALFFACNCHSSDNGYLYCFTKNAFDEEKGIDYEKRDAKGNDVLIVPAGKSSRVIAQHSVFVHSYKGFLPVEDALVFKISSDKKLAILNYLAKRCDISDRTIYNDLLGFIQNQRNRFDAVEKFIRGYIYQQEGNLNEAKKSYSDAIDLNPQYDHAYNNRGVVKGKLRDYEGAIADFNGAIILNPKYAEAYHNRGNAKGQLPDYEGAIADFDEAIRLNPQYAEAYNNRGDAKAQLDDYKGAIADHNEAIRLNPQYAGAYNNRGATKEDMGDLEGAEADYQKALEIDPQHEHARQNLEELQKKK